VQLAQSLQESPNSTDVMAAVAATEERLSARIDCLEATVNGHDDILQQLKGARLSSPSSSAPPS
jgi:hypothetical protein